MICSSLYRWAVSLCLMHTASAQGHAQLTFSRNLVYSGKEVRLTFSYGSGLQLTRFTIDAFNGTLIQGSLLYQATPGIYNRTGVFANTSLNGWPNIPAAASNVSLTFVATPAHELDYNGSAVLFDSSKPPFGAVVTLISSPIRLLVYSHVQLTFSSNPVYIGQVVTLTFSYPSGLQLMQFTIDAFNDTNKKGSLLFQANLSICIAEGVFANTSLNGWPRITPAASSFILTFMATPAHELDYNGSAVVFDGTTSTLESVLLLTRSAVRLLVNSHAQLTFSRDLVYSGKEVTLTFSYHPGLQLLSLTINALNGTNVQGFIFYQVNPSKFNQTGVFTSTSVNGWPNIPASASSFSFTFVVTPAHELVYNGSAVVYDSRNLSLGSTLMLTSSLIPLHVYIYPSPPKFHLSPIVINESDSGVIICDSVNGRPAAAVSLTVNSLTGLTAAGSGSDSAFVNLSSFDLPLSKWHDAVAICTVTNHKTNNFSVSSDVKINYLSITNVPIEICSDNESVVLNCSAYISYYPGVIYRWTLPSAAKITGSLLFERIVVPQNQAGLFKCTASNNVTMASVVITFTVSSVSSSSNPKDITLLETAGCKLCWIIGVVFGVIVVVIIAVVFGVLC